MSVKGDAALRDIGRELDEGRRAELDRIRELLGARMERAHRREEHSVRTAVTAASLAQSYGVDIFFSAAAGLVHDWDKVLTDEELVARAVRYGVPLAGSPLLIAPLLHGPVAAFELPEIFPKLPVEVFQAVSRHTVGAPDMTELDMTVFVADAIEPGRRGAHAERLRAMAGKASLTAVFLACLAQGLIYVVETGRYVYPPTVDTYNRYATTCRKGDS